MMGWKIVTYLFFILDVSLEQIDTLPVVDDEDHENDVQRVNKGWVGQDPVENYLPSFVQMNQCVDRCKPGLIRGVGAACFSRLS